MKPPAKPVFTAKRLEALADGVFAIVMTLLVLELALPEHDHGELSDQLVALWPKIVSYCLSFFILGIYWIIHHKIFENIKRYDSTLAWLNIIFLMIVSLIPFTTSLIGKHFLEPLPTQIYGVQLLIMFIMGFLLFTYSTSGYRLVDNDYNEKVIKKVKVMGYLYFSILTLAILASFFIPLISICIYSIVVLVFIIFSILGKDEYVMVGVITKEPDK